MPVCASSHKDNKSFFNWAVQAAARAAQTHNLSNAMHKSKIPALRAEQIPPLRAGQIPAQQMEIASGSLGPFVDI